MLVHLIGSKPVCPYFFIGVCEMVSPGHANRSYVHTAPPGSPFPPLRPGNPGGPCGPGFPAAPASPAPPASPYGRM